VPQMLQGIPLDVRYVNVTVDRPGFIFNPTSCEKQQVTGTLTSALGTPFAVSAPFQATNCAALKFAPKFSVSVAAKTGKKIGTGLTATLAEPAGSMGSQANITRVKVELPRQMPSVLTTLQKACLAKVFEEDPEHCPEHSVVGQAVVHTQLLPVPLEGKAYFVSHGDEAFPSLTMVLKGYGVTVDLIGTTYIDPKTSITSTTFQTVPDVPFESFTLTLNQGEYPALGAYLPGTSGTSFCGQKLVMPTEMIAQNGLAIYQNTPIAVTGCPKVKTLTRKQKLAKALKACHKKKGDKRASCERAARKAYGAKAAKQKR
jgi:hypothetical protein